MKIKLYVGLDVHKNSIVVATALDRGGEPQAYGKWGGSNLAVERGLLKLRKSFGVDKSEISLVYEAGPSGFVLVRRLSQLGYHCIVVAPSEVPSKAGDRVKTDKRDARKLARLHRAGELTAIHVPAARDEAVRDLCRARTDAMQALARAKQQLGMFMLRNGFRYDGKTNWTQAHLNYLRRTPMPHPAQQLVLEEYLLEVDALTQRVARIEAHMIELLPSWEREPYVRALMACKGFKEVAAMTVISELGDLSRFTHPRQLMGYLGLVPEEASSGERRRQGGITKTGNGHARWMLIECASHYSHAPRVSPQLSARQAGQSREVRAIAWRAQNRLNARFKRLAARQLHRNKIVVAVARELCGFIWELHHQVSAEVDQKTGA
ncbi:MAG: IS110 family transposase [Verrucomicrobiae bacterium]|nr:IS110 family transposase [Verrucomicrobiae bacterium]